MADPTSNDVRGERPVGAAVPAPADPERQLPEEAAAARGIPDYEDPEVARRHIEATRARMSTTIDEIEGSLLRKKERLQSRLDVSAPIRRNPWQAMGIALGAGLILGLLTASGEDDDEHEEEIWGGRHPDHLDRRTAMLEARTRRLVRIARQQERDLEMMRRRRQHGSQPHGAFRNEQARSEPDPSRFDEIRETILVQLADFVGRMLRPGASGRGA